MDDNRKNRLDYALSIVARVMPVLAFIWTVLKDVLHLGRP